VRTSNKQLTINSKQKTKIILAIETSCDETAASVIEVDFNRSEPKIETLSSVVKSQIKLHSKMGGVVPEAAARAHVKYIRPVVEQALQATRYKLPAFNYIAVTAGPGLIPSLLVGVEFAKALSLATGKPIIPINHMLGHLYSPMGKIKDLGLKIKDVFPQIALIVSGGHTILVLMKNIKEYKVLGETVDDAAGEAFDKVAKLLKLPYPGGPEVSKLALKGSPSAINFPRPMIYHKNYNFSFSGLKTAVLYYLKDNGLKIKDFGFKQDLCASFQQAVIDVLVSKTLRAAKEFKANSISLSGGVAANTVLRDTLNLKSKILNLKFFVPPKNLCTDNAEMIGLAAAYSLINGKKPQNFRTIKADPNLRL
jgi:N6-L-threonylcarbamoyladenine synthase